MPTYAVIEAPSALGLRPTGVETLPDALRAAGLYDRLGVGAVSRVDVPPYAYERDLLRLVNNVKLLRSYTLRLALVTGYAMDDGHLPLVIGGDCSILLGPMLALKRRGRYGLCHIDGHADFYQASASPTGEAADMALALVTGRGEHRLTNIAQNRPYVRDEDGVQIGYRDGENAAADGSQDIRDTDILAFNLETVRANGVGVVAATAVTRLTARALAGFWVHLDVDVLDDAVMPAVDYRQPDGVSYDELGVILTRLLATGRMAGMTVTILNPKLDADGSVVAQFSQFLGDVLAP